MYHHKHKPKASSSPLHLRTSIDTDSKQVGSEFQSPGSIAAPLSPSQLTGDDLKLDSSCSSIPRAISPTIRIKLKNRQAPVLSLQDLLDAQKQGAVTQALPEVSPHVALSMLKTKKPQEIYAASHQKMHAPGSSGSS